MVWNDCIEMHFTCETPAPLMSVAKLSLRWVGSRFYSSFPVGLESIWKSRYISKTKIWIQTSSSHLNFFSWQHYELQSEVVWICRFCNQIFVCTQNLSLICRLQHIPVWGLYLVKTCRGSFPTWLLHSSQSCQYTKAISALVNGGSVTDLQSKIVGARDTVTKLLTF